MKTYLALLSGVVTQETAWDDQLERDRSTRITKKADTGEGRRALTEVVPEAVEAGFTLARIILHTGLTHQIRAQAAIHGVPLAGDELYGGESIPGNSGYLLHAHRLCLPPDSPLHPGLELVAELPQAHRDEVLRIMGPQRLRGILDDG